MQSRRKILLILFLLAVAIASLWLRTIIDNWLFAALCVTSGLAAALIVISLLRQNSREFQNKSKSYTLKMMGVAVGAILIFLSAASLWITRDRAIVMLHPGRSTIDAFPQANRIENYLEVKFQTFDGLNLRGWYIPTQNGATIIFVHGNGGNRGQLITDASLFTALGYGALLYDARNSGLSEGELTTFGLLEVGDVRAAVDFVTAQPGTDPDRIALFGHSMGGATVIMAAAQIPQVRSVISQSTYTSVYDNIKDGLQRFTGLPSFPFAPLVIFWGELESGINIQDISPIDHIALISPRPILLVHGALDETIPVDNAYRLFKAARQPKELYILPAANHCCLAQIGGEAYFQKLSTFLAQSLAP